MIFTFCVLNYILLYTRVRFCLDISSENELLQKMWPDGDKSVTSITKRPVTSGTEFKNSIIALVDNLESKVRFAP